MLTEFFQYLKNWFEISKIFSSFSVSNGVLSYSDGKDIPLSVGQLYRIVGSSLNNGVYKYGTDELTDETFTGAVWVMAVPPAVMALADDIEKWTTENGKIIDSPYQSESFGGYSGTLKSGSSGCLSWKDQFAARLAPWRKI